MHLLVRLSFPFLAVRVSFWWSLSRVRPSESMKTRSLWSGSLVWVVKPPIFGFLFWQTGVSVLKSARRQWVPWSMVYANLSVLPSLFISPYGAMGVQIGSMNLIYGWINRTENGPSWLVNAAMLQWWGIHLRLSCNISKKLFFRGYIILLIIITITCPIWLITQCSLFCLVLAVMIIGLITILVFRIGRLIGFLVTFLVMIIQRSLIMFIIKIWISNALISFSRYVEKGSFLRNCCMKKILQLRLFSID
jgi:hypothetical protein